ncbi:MAG: ATP-binding protein [Oscillospiraceae bacterium]|nr:ATP-binding protein [Oscillospiraceae bacterium]
MNVKISGGIVRKRQKVVIYGPEGVGKSTLAAQFPNPLFIDTEGSTGNLDVNRFEDKPTSWSMLLNYIEYVKQNPQICDTLVIDTMDWAERLCVEDILNTHGKKGIEDFGYGNGYVYVAEAVGRFLNILQELIDKDICNVVLNCHSQLKKFEQPDEAGSYDRYELKLGKKTGSQTAPLVKEWADMILFCNYETYAVATDKDGKKFKAQGGQRVMYTTHHPCWDAKNRAGLPAKLPLDYSQIAHVIEHTSSGSSATTPPSVSAPTIKPTENNNAVQSSVHPAQTQNINTPATPAASTTPVPQSNIDLSDFEEVICEPNIPPDIPKALQDLMRANNVSEEDIRFAVSSKGYFPERMPVADYPPDFINGVLIAAWEQVYAMIKENKKLPF